MPSSIVWNYCVGFLCEFLEGSGLEKVWENSRSVLEGSIVARNLIKKSFSYSIWGTVYLGYVTVRTARTSFQGRVT